MLNICRENYIALDVYLSSTDVFITKQFPSKSMTELLCEYYIFHNLFFSKSFVVLFNNILDFAADFGGQLGLFLGASVLTIVEFLEYFITKCYRCSHLHATHRHKTVKPAAAEPQTHNGHI